MPEPSRRKRWRDALHWQLRGWRRRLGGDRAEWEALAAWQGLAHQAFHAQPLSLRLCDDLWDRGRFRSSRDLPAFYSPVRRERENSSHHYGHDIQLKRHAGLPLVGHPLPLLLEHGLKVARESSFESPRPWSRAFLCMGPLRARWVEERFGLPALPIGPWIAYARPLLSPERLQALRAQLGSTLLVVMAHSWDAVERRMDLDACWQAVEDLRRRAGYRTVLLLRHWKDPQWSLPPDWLVACNGHRSNPWFLDSMATLMALADGLATNAFGTHLGYGLQQELALHWIDVQPEQDLSALQGGRAEAEAIEWRERQRLSTALAEGLEAGDRAGVRRLLDPYWGFDCVRSAEALRPILRGEGLRR